MPLIWLMMNGNIDFVPFLGLLLPPSLGVIALSVKPQVGIGMILLYFKRYDWKIFIPLTIILILSLIVYKSWFVHMTPTIVPGRQVQFFPWLVPLGLYLLYRSWRENDDAWAALASLCIVPYYGFWSLTFPLALLSIKHKSTAFCLVACIVVLSSYRDIYMSGRELTLQKHKGGIFFVFLQSCI